MASTALVRMQEKLKGSGASLAKVRGSLKGTEGPAGAGKAVGVGAIVGAAVAVLEKRLPRAHEKVPHALFVTGFAAIAASATKGDTSRFFSSVAASGAAITVDDWIEGMEDSVASAEGEQ